MKKLIKLLLPLFLLTACLDNNANPDIDEEKIIYPTSSEVFDPDNTKLGDITYEISDDNLLLSYTTNWLDTFGGGWNKVAFEYDENNNKIKETKTYHYSDYASIRHFEYDENNNLVKEYWEGDTNSYTLYTYDEKGFKKDLQYYNNGEPSIAKTVFTCNEDGLIIREDNYYEGNLYYWYENKYNEDGDLIEIAYYSNGNNLWSLYYIYDSEGRLEKQGIVLEDWKFNGTLVHHYE